MGRGLLLGFRLSLRKSLSQLYELLLIVTQRLPPHRSRQGSAAQRLFRAREVQGQAHPTFRRHKPHKGEARVPRCYRRGLRASRHQARPGIIHQ